METKFGPDQIYDFLKLVVTTGDTHYIEPDHTIWRKSDNTPVGVNLYKGKEGRRQVALYKENMTMGNFVLLNPFVESVGFSAERNWFYMWMQVLPGCLIREAMVRMAERALSKDDDTGYKGSAVMAKFIDRIDEKFLSELAKLRSVDIMLIYYAKDQKIAQLNSALWEKEYEQQVIKSKLRKSTLMLIRDMVATMLQTDKPEEILYTATLLGCPQFDAMMHVLFETLKRIAPVYEPMTGTSLHIKELEEHLQHLEAYHKAMQWLASYTAAPKTEEKEEASTSVSDAMKSPWERAASEEIQNGKAVDTVSSALGVKDTTVQNPTYMPQVTGAGTLAAPMVVPMAAAVDTGAQDTVSSLMASGGAVPVAAPPPPSAMYPMGGMVGGVMPSMPMGYPSFGGGYGAGMVSNPGMMMPGMPTFAM